MKEDGAVILSIDSPGWVIREDEDGTAPSVAVARIGESNSRLRVGRPEHLAS